MIPSAISLRAKAVRVPRVLPAFGLSLGITVAGLSVLLLIPLAVLILRGVSAGWEEFASAALSDRALTSYRLTFLTAIVAAFCNLAIGMLMAWTLVRHRFPGRRLLDGLVDLPFALPTAVAGIALTTLYSPQGWLGKPLLAMGIKVAFTPLGIIMAMIFVGVPFVVRAVQPVLEDLDPAYEEASYSLGANRFQTLIRVIMPMLLPATLTGFSLALARGIGEYGSVVFIAGNLPYRTELTSLLIVAQLEEFDYTGATSIALVMLGVSFLILLGLNVLQRKACVKEEKQ